MPIRLAHDSQTPQNWPDGITYLTKPRLSPTFPQQLIPFLLGDPSKPQTNIQPRPISHPTSVAIKKISTTSHPAHGQNGLFTKRKFIGNELIVPYIGIIHATFTSADIDSVTEEVKDEHTDSDYDLSLLRISASHISNPFPGQHVSIGVDAATAGNAGRFVNDFRGIASAPNAEFRLSKGETGELRMEIWSLKQGIPKGEEVLVSYGKGWWGARRE